jgi:hypothetical protein
MTTITTSQDCRAAAYGARLDRRLRPAYMRGIPGCVWQHALPRRPHWTRQTAT